MATRNKEREFIRFDKGTPLSAFIGAKDYSPETGGSQVSFTIGSEVEFMQEGAATPESLDGKRGIISTLDLNVLYNNMVPAVLKGAPGQLHRHHQVTPEEALVIKNEFDIALGMAEILRADATSERSGPEGTDLG